MANRYAAVFTIFENSPIVRQLLDSIPNATDENIVFCYDRRKIDSRCQFSVYRNCDHMQTDAVKINAGVDLMSEKIWFVKESGEYSAVVEYSQDYRPNIIVTPHLPLLAFSPERTPHIPGFY